MDIILEGITHFQQHGKVAYKFQKKFHFQEAFGSSFCQVVINFESYSQYSFMFFNWFSVTCSSFQADFQRFVSRC